MSFDKATKKRFWKYVNKTEMCWLWTGGLTSTGYGQFHPTNKTCHLAHRFSWSLENGPIPKNLFILHECDVRECVNPQHLYAGTHQDNMRDMRERGRSNTARGEDHSRTKFTNEKILKILKLHKQGWGYQNLAYQFKTTKSCIQKILTGRSWAHLTGIKRR